MVSWIVSASVKRKQPSASGCAPAQQALFLPVNHPRVLRSSGGASRRITPSWVTAALRAIWRVLIGRGIVDDDDLPLQSEREAGFGLDQKGGEAVWQRLFLVAGWDDDGELKFWFSPVWGRLVVGISHDFVL